MAETGSGWFRLFKLMDDDGSGRISYHELIGMIREELRLDAHDLPEGRVQAVWKALDSDSSGYIGAGEFGAFMRRADGHAVGGFVVTFTHIIH